MALALEISSILSCRYSCVLKSTSCCSIFFQNVHQYNRTRREPAIQVESAGVFEQEERLKVRVPREFNPLREEDENNDTESALQREEPKRMQRYQWERIKFRRQEEEGPPNPSLLTYAAKEQLLYLHRTDPETWTPHRLSTAFPLSIVDVRRILRRHRKPRLIPPDFEETAEQDRLVAERWKALKNGKGGDVVSQEQREAYAAGTLVLASPSGIQPGLPGVPPPLQPVVLPAPPLGPVGRLLTTYIQREEAKKLEKLNKENKNQNQSNQLVSLRSRVGTALNDNIRVAGTDLSTAVARGTSTASSFSVSGPGTAFSDVASFTTADTAMSQYSYEDHAPWSDPPRRYPEKPVSYKGAEVVLEEDEEADDEMDMRMRTSGRKMVPPGKVSHDVAKERLLTRLEKPDKFGNKSAMGEAYRKWFEESEAAATKPSIVTKLQTLAAQKENEVAVGTQPPKWKGSGEEVDVESQVPRFRSLRRQVQDSHREKSGVEDQRMDEEPSNMKIPVQKDGRPSSTVYRKGNAFYDADGEFLYSIPS